MVVCVKLVQDAAATIIFLTTLTWEDLFLSVLDIDALRRCPCGDSLQIVVNAIIMADDVFRLHRDGGDAIGLLVAQAEKFDSMAGDICLQGAAHLAFGLHFPNVIYWHRLIGAIAQEGEVEVERLLLGDIDDELHGGAR